MPTPHRHRRGNGLSLAYRHFGTSKQRKTRAFAPELLESFGSRPRFTDGTHVDSLGSVGELIDDDFDPRCHIRR